MATSIEAQGHTVDEAIQIALNQLGVSRDKVEIDILHHPRRGLFGIGARRAKVRATIRESVMLDGEEFDMSGGSDLDDKPRRRRRRGGRNRGGRGDERPETASEASPRQAAPAQGPPSRDGGRNEGDRRGGRRGGEGEAGRPRTDDGGRSREDRRGGGRNRGEQRPERGGSETRPEFLAPRAGGDQRGGQPQPQRSADEVREGGRQDGREGGREGGGRPEPRDRSPQRGRQGQAPRDQGDRRERGRAPRPPRPDSADDIGTALQDSSRRPLEVETPSASLESRSVPISTSRQNAPDEPPLDREALEEIRAKAEDLVRELLKRMGFAAEVSSSVDEAAGEAVISVRSESEGLLIGRRGQTLDSLEHLVNRMALRGDTQVEGRVLLDIGDYRKRRRESLDELASRLRSRAVGERRTVQVSPMSPRDRKFFAQAFADDDSVEVRALGAGFYRRVIVAPAGMGAAAVAAAEAAGDSDAETIEVETGFSTAPAEN